MLRWLIAAALVVTCTSAFAQFTVDAGKGLKFGIGCVGPMSTFAPRLGTCTIDGAKSRIWCPNGKVFDRIGGLAQISIVRSMCDLNQIL